SGVLKARVAGNQVRALPRQLGDDVLVEQRVAQLDDAEQHHHDERQNQREFDDALAAGAGEALLHWNLPSFLIAESTVKWICPPLKNGLTSGVKSVHV